MSLSQYMSHCFVIVNWTHMNKHHWHLNQQKKIVFEENVFQNVVGKKTTFPIQAPMYQNCLLSCQEGNCHNTASLNLCAVKILFKPLVWSVLPTMTQHYIRMISKLLAHYEWNPLVTSGFSSQRASNAELWFFVSLNMLPYGVFVSHRVNMGGIQMVARAPGIYNQEEAFIWAEPAILYVLLLCTNSTTDQIN